MQNLTGVFVHFLFGVDSPIDELLAVAGSMGYAEEEVLMLFDEGYGYDEVTELMNDPCLFRACIAEYGWEMEI